MDRVLSFLRRMDCVDQRPSGSEWCEVILPEYFPWIDWTMPPCNLLDFILLIGMQCDRTERGWFQWLPSIVLYSTFCWKVHCTFGSAMPKASGFNLRMDLRALFFWSGLRNFPFMFWNTYRKLLLDWVSGSPNGWSLVSGRETLVNVIQVYQFPSPLVLVG